MENINARKVENEQIRALKIMMWKWNQLYLRQAQIHFQSIYDMLDCFQKTRKNAMHSVHSNWHTHQTFNFAKDESKVNVNPFKWFLKGTGFFGVVLHDVSVDLPWDIKIHLQQWGAYPLSNWLLHPFNAGLHDGDDRLNIEINLIGGKDMNLKTPQDSITNE